MIMDVDNYITIIKSLFFVTFIDNPQLLLTRNEAPTDSNGRPRFVWGVTLLDNNLYVIYYKYGNVQVFDCEEDSSNKVREIQINELKTPGDMVGSSKTSQLFISEWNSVDIWRVNLNKKPVMCSLNWKPRPLVFHWPRIACW